jgi:Flp pilus assembly secretin CpaC
MIQTRRFSRNLAGALAALALHTATGEPANAQSAMTAELVVKYDQVVLQPLERPASQIIVGNPSIAEVSLQANNMLAITGKTFGVTNLIVLDQEQKQIFNVRLMVKTDDNVVTLTRAGATATLSCTPRCQPMLKIGDDKETFALLAQASSQKMKISESQDAGQPSN